MQIRAEDMLLLAWGASQDILTQHGSMLYYSRSCISSGSRSRDKLLPSVTREISERAMFYLAHPLTLTCCRYVKGNLACVLALLCRIRLTSTLRLDLRPSQAVIGLSYSRYIPDTRKQRRILLTSIAHADPFEESPKGQTISDVCEAGQAFGSRWGFA